MNIWYLKDASTRQIVLDDWKAQVKETYEETVKAVNWIRAAAQPPNGIIHLMVNGETERLGAVLTIPEARQLHEIRRDRER